MFPAHLTGVIAGQYHLIFVLHVNYFSVYTSQYNLVYPIG